MIALPNTFTFLCPFLRRLLFGRALGKPDRFFFFCKILPIMNDEVVGLRGSRVLLNYRRYRNFFMFARAWHVCSEP